MKKLITLLFVSVLIFSCSSSEDVSSIEKPEKPEVPEKPNAPKKVNNFPVK